VDGRLEESAEYANDIVRALRHVLPREVNDLPTRCSEQRVAFHLLLKLRPLLVLAPPVDFRTHAALRPSCIEDETLHRMMESGGRKPAARKKVSEANLENAVRGNVAKRPVVEYVPQRNHSAPARPGMSAKPPF